MRAQAYVLVVLAICRAQSNHVSIRLQDCSGLRGVCIGPVLHRVGRARRLENGFSGFVLLLAGRQAKGIGERAVEVIAVFTMQFNAQEAVEFRCFAVV